MNRNQKNKEREQGSALLLCLGILSLVLILAMSFAYSANTRKSIATTKGAIVGTRSLADDVTQLTLTDMKFMFDYAATHDLDYVYAPVTLSKLATAQQVFVPRQLKLDGAEVQNYITSTNLSLTSHTGEDGEVGKLFGIFTEGGSYRDYAYLRDSSIGKFLPQVCLMTQDATFRDSLNYAPPVMVSYKLNDGATEHTETRVIGRYAYLILDETGKLNVNDTISLLHDGDLPWTVDHYEGGSHKNLGGGRFCDRIATYNESDASGSDAEFFFDICNSGTYDHDHYVENQTVRLGLLMEELHTDMDYYDSNLFGEETFAGWLSYSHLVEKVGDHPYRSGPKPTKFDDDDVFAYTFFSGEDIEAYWDETDKTEIARFDLSGASWQLGAPGSLSDVLNDKNTAGWKISTDNAESCKLIKLLCGYAEDGSITNDPACDKLEFWENAPALADWHRREKLSTPCYPNYFIEHFGATTSKGYIDWLHRMVDENGTKIGFHVAANLKDYCDPDNYATFKGKLVPGDDGKFEEPEFCGNERVAYINEVVVRGATQTANTADAVSYELYLYTGIELLNMYCSCNSTSGECDVPVGKAVARVIGKVKVFRQQYKQVLEDDGDGNMVWKGDFEPVPETFSELTPFAMSTTADGTYVELTSADGWYNWHETTPTTGNIPAKHLGYNTICLEKKLFIPSELALQIESQHPSDETHFRYIFRFEVDDIIVFTRDDASGDDVEMLYDVASLPIDTPYVDKENPSAGDAEFLESKTAFFKDNALRDIVDFQAVDARCNHRRMKNVTWSVWDSSATYNTMDSEDSQDNMNAGGDHLKDYTGVEEYSPSDTKDFEDEVTFDGSDKATYSTAYIRNAPMRSLWELGAIHRAYPNQTINLKKFTRKTGTEVAKYSDGDAQILDQVKIGPLMFVKGKFNVNNPNPAAWKKLLKDIEYTWYDGKTSIPSQHNTSEGAADDYKFAESALKTATRWDSTNKEDYFYRGRVANILLDGTDPIVIGQNDRDLESWVGKTAQLLTTRLEAYTMLIAVESLKELTEITTDAEYDALADTLLNPVKVKTGDDSTVYCSVTGRQKVLVHFIRDAWNNEFRIVKKQYLEE